MFDETLGFVVTEIDESDLQLAIKGSHRRLREEVSLSYCFESLFYLYGPKKDEQTKLHEYLKKFSEMTGTKVIIYEHKFSNNLWLYTRNKLKFS